MGDVKDAVEPGDIVETRDLWLVQFRSDGSYPWTDIGVDRADAGAALRTYDFYLENHKDLEVRMVETLVERRVADVEKLRESLVQKTPAGTDTAIQSE